MTKRTLLTLIASLCAVCGLRAQTAQDSATVRLETSPEAVIGIDGDISSTNLLSTRVAAGQHKVTVVYGTDFRKEYELDVQAGGQHDFKFLISGEVTINAVPKGAAVYVDGIRRGTAPLTLSLLGKHSLRVAADPVAYYDYNGQLDVAPFEPQTQNITLSKRPPRLYGMAIATASSSASVGVLLAVCRRFGAFLHYHGKPGNKDLALSRDNGWHHTIKGPGMYEKDYTSHLAASLGVMARCHKHWYAYLGAGFAMYTQRYKPKADNTQYDSSYPITPYGSEGCALDMGVIYKWKALLLTAGYETIVAKSYPAGNHHHEVYVGVGVSIHKQKKNK